MTRGEVHQLPKTHTRERILDAAERLLAQGDAAFSMRALADEAGLSFATPFNQYGSKGAIMLALSARRIELMHARLGGTALPVDAVDRILMAADVAASVMCADPTVNRAVMAAIGAPIDTPGNVSSRSSAFWAEALGAGTGLSDTALALAVLPDQLAVMFRGVLSFWTAGEIADRMLVPRARDAAAIALLGFTRHADRTALMQILSTGGHPMGSDLGR